MLKWGEEMARPEPLFDGMRSRFRSRRRIPSTFRAGLSGRAVLFVLPRMRPSHFPGSSRQFQRRRRARSLEARENEGFDRDDLLLPSEEKALLCPSKIKKKRGKPRVLTSSLSLPLSLPKLQISLPLSPQTPNLSPSPQAPSTTWPSATTSTASTSAGPRPEGSR